MFQKFIKNVLWIGELNIKLLQKELIQNQFYNLNYVKNTQTSVLNLDNLKIIQNMKTFVQTWSTRRGDHKYILFGIFESL